MCHGNSYYKFKYNPPDSGHALRSTSSVRRPPSAGCIIRKPCTSADINVWRDISAGTKVKGCPWQRVVREKHPVHAGLLHASLFLILNILH